MRINAQQSGNWSDPSVWRGPVPSLGDEVYCNGFTLYIDTDVKTGFITNSQTYYDTVGGQLIITKDNCVIEARLLSSNVPLINFSGNKLTIKGDIQGSINTGYTPCIVNTGNLEVEGTVKGGDGGYCPAIINQETGTVGVTGLVCNGGGGWSYGIYNEGTGKVVINNIETTERYIGEFCQQQDLPPII